MFLSTCSKLSALARSGHFSEKIASPLQPALNLLGHMTAELDL